MAKIPVALVQFNAVPEAVEENRNKMENLAERAVQLGARWVVFHEGTVSDYTPRLADLAEPVPDGESTRRMCDVAARLNCTISFGLSEVENGKYYIAQVFVGPQGFFYRYRKTWLCRREGDEGYRNEWARYDPGMGPELFEIDGVRATCFICSDGAAPRCIERVRQLEPEVVFYPHNVRRGLRNIESRGQKAETIQAPMLVTNRVGRSWTDECLGGCAFFSAKGALLAKSNQENREEILIHTLDLP